MSPFAQELLPVLFMFTCVLALGPFIAGAMWLAFDGDRLRETADAANATATEGTAPDAALRTAA